MATLEEFIQEKYVENFETLNSVENKVEAFINTKNYSNYFYVPVNEGVGGLRYVIDGDGHALYLIKKSGLPKEIREVLVGGEAGDGDYVDYQNLSDVYGVTSNLKVYYCKNGANTILGIAKDELDFVDLTESVFDSSKDSNLFGVLSKYDKSEDGELTLNELKEISEITITENDGISSLKDLYYLVNLERIIFDNASLDSLSGLENVGKLKDVTFKNYRNGNKIDDYSMVSKFTNLENLSIIDGTQEQVDSIFGFMTQTDYSKLKNLNIYGSDYKNPTDIFNVSALSKLTQETAYSISKLSFNCNKLNSISGIEKFVNVVTTDFSYNSNLKSLKSLENLNKLEKLTASYCNLGEDEIYLQTDEDGDGFDDGRNKENDSLVSLINKRTLKSIDISNNSNLKYIGYIDGCSNLGTLYLAGCPNLIGNEVRRIKDIFLNCGVRSIDKALERFLSSDTRLVLRKNGTSLTKDSPDFLALWGNTDCTELDLSNNDSLTNEDLQTTLATMVNMEFLDLSGLPLLTSINFVKNMPNLSEILLFNTNVKDVSPLANCEKLINLGLNGTDINLVPIQGNISKMRDNLNKIGVKKSWLNSGAGIVFESASCWKALEDCTELTDFLSHTRNRSLCNGFSCDLSRTKVKSFSIHGCGVTFTFPNTLENGFEVRFPENGFKADMSLCTKVTQVGMSDMGTSNSSTFNVTIHSLSTLPNLELLNFAGLNGCKWNSEAFSEANTFGNLKTLILGDGVGSFRWIGDFGSLTGITSVNKLVIYYPNLSVTDFSNIGTLTNLTTLQINGSSLSNIDFIENLTKLTLLNLKSNKIVSCVALRNLKSLEELNLENNVLEPMVVFNGQSVNNLEFLAKLNPNYKGEVDGGKGSLTALYLAGNNDLKDFSKVSSISWTKGKSGF